MKKEAFTYKLIIALLLLALALFITLYFKQHFEAKAQQPVLDNSLVLANEQLKAELASLKLEHDAASSELVTLRAMSQPTAAPAKPKLDSFDAGKVFAVGEPLPEESFICKMIVEGDEVYNRIYGKSYVENEYIALSELRYIKLLHCNFDGDIQVGELIVNAALVQDLREIFAELLKHEYQIEKMLLIDDYWTGDAGSSDYDSIDANNSSAFCFREATGSGHISQHALGRAIDINPQQNPYVSYKSGYASFSHDNAAEYVSRTAELPHIIDHDDLCYKLFTAHGFGWGGDWNEPKDYQHFDKRVSS